jgi:hypothetical protein
MDQSIKLRQIAVEFEKICCLNIRAEHASKH